MSCALRLRVGSVRGWRGARLGRVLQDLVYQAELQRLARVHELVPLQRLVDELQRLAGVLHVDGVQLPLQVGDLLRLDEDVGGLAARPAATLPPGLLMYMWIGFLALSDWRKRSCATTML